MAVGWETVRFGLDGTSYEIDLSTAEARELRVLLARYVAAGREVGPPVRIPAPRRAPGRVERRESRVRNAAIRQWARDHGLPVTGRGRIPDQVQNAYRARPAPRHV